MHINYIKEKITNIGSSEKQSKYKGAFGHEFLATSVVCMGSKMKAVNLPSSLEDIRKTDIGSGNWRYHWCI